MQNATKDQFPGGVFIATHMCFIKVIDGLSPKRRTIE